MFRSKIQGAAVIIAERNQECFITIDKRLLDSADILPYEKVQVVNMNNGNLLETYVIPGERDSGIVCLNGSAERFGNTGDKIEIITYAQMTDEEAKKYAPTVVLVDKQNKIKKVL